MIPRVPRAKGPRVGRWALAAALATLAHGAFLGLLLFLSLIKFEDRPNPRANARPVVLRPIANQQWAQNRGEQRAEDDRQQLSKASPRQLEEKKKEEKKANPKPEGQVVAVAPGNNEEDPNAKYLAESANKVKKETRAKDTTAFYRNAMPQRTVQKKQEGEGQDQTDAISLGGNRGKAMDDRPTRENAVQKAVLEVASQKERTELAMREPTKMGAGPELANRDEAAELKGNSQRNRIQQGGAEGEQEASLGRLGEPGKPTLMPSPGVVDKIIGAAANDHLKDVEEGDGTYLNTREWKYASFFNRVKQSVGQHWNPSAQLRLRDPTGVIYGGKDRYTVLSVTLNDSGMVKDIYVEKSSGIDFLDLEAVHSFERAQPFVNPPPGLVDNDAKVRFSFGFMIDMGGGPRMRLFRSAN
jgi:TonB family protein